MITACSGLIGVSCEVLKDDAYYIAASILEEMLSIGEQATTLDAELVRSRMETAKNLSPLCAAPTE